MKANSKNKTRTPGQLTSSQLPYLDISAEFIQDLLLLNLTHVNLLHVIPEVHVFKCWELLHLQKQRSFLVHFLINKEPVWLMDLLQLKFAVISIRV